MKSPLTIGITLLAVLLGGGALVMLLPKSRLISAGHLDPTFGRGGRTLGPEGQVSALLRLPDGMILSGGCALQGCARPALVRYRAAGSHDSSFGNGGRVLVEFPEAIPADSAPNKISALILQRLAGNQSRIVAAAGYPPGRIGRFMLFRYMLDGRLDPSFGTGGIAIGPLGSPEALAAQPDGRLVAAGLIGGDAAVVRFLANGDLDATFGAGGMITADLGGNADVANAIVVNAKSGQIVVAANSFPTWPEQSTGSWLLGFQSRGAVDTSFGAGTGKGTGRMVTALKNISSLVGTRDGRLVSAGRLAGRFAVARFSARGAPDSSFGEKGVALGPAGRAAALVVADGKLVAAGRSISRDRVDFSRDTSDAVVARLNGVGLLDVDFGSKGAVTTDFGARVDYSSAAILAGDKVVIGGASGKFGAQNVLARYHLTRTRSLADVSIHLTDEPNRVVQGGAISYRLQVENLSSANAYGVKVKDRLPAGVDFTSADSTQGVCSVVGRTVICDLGGIRGGDTASITIVTGARLEGIQRDSVKVSSSSSDPSDLNNVARVSTRVNALELWSATGPMPQALANHTSTLLDTASCRSPDAPLWCGKVLVIGSDGFAMFGQLYSPLDGSWAPAAPVPGGDRQQHTATLLSDGRVLVIGGNKFPGDLDRADIYDPSTNSWAAAGSMGVGRSGHVATRLNDGRVLVAGGRSADRKAPPACGVGEQEMALSSAEIFDPKTARWTAAPSMAFGRRFGLGNFTATVLTDGKVLVVGGYRGDAFDSSLKQRQPPCDGSDFAAAELFDPAASGGKGVWIPTGDTAIGRSGHTATLLANGKVLVTGGDTSVLSPAGDTSAEIYDPAAIGAQGFKGAWFPAKPMLRARAKHTATLLPNGLVLVAGGRARQGGDQAFPRRDAELYNPVADEWVAAGFLLQDREGHTADLLPPGPASRCGPNCGKVLLAGGNGSGTQENSSGTPLKSAELFTGAGK